ncbi:sensor histidine kinase [Actinacidiphila glaucinigra]|uniref:sensor histidine kinase n=1 Tax=Actinacidiphila glaucinigra TaxID=235986 RepID=UPI003D89DC96
MIQLLPQPPRSLRRRLILGVTILATAAVLASQAIGYMVLQSWLLDRVDEQLVEFHPPAPAFHDALDGILPAPGERPDMLPSDFHVYFYDASGRRLNHSLGSEAKPGPQLADEAQSLGLRDGHPETVPATSGDGRWRVLLNPGPEGASAVVTLPLDTVDGAASKILWLNAVLLAVTLVALLALGRWVVRLGLMPLTRMESTAQDITEGRLDLRLPDTDPRTEIGRLSRVLNSMLDRLQKALLARETSEARLRRFVADAGHELRTPLTAIQGYAQLALRTERRPAQELKEANRFIAQNAERMSLLVDDLQLLATLDKEPYYRKERVDLLSLAADAVSATAAHCASHPIGLGPLHNTAADPTGAEEFDVAETVGDPHRLRQILENLLSNARIHTPHGTRVHVRVGTAEAGSGTGGTDRPGRFSASPSLAEHLPVSVIEVADEGPGLEPADAELVFERFYRADPARSRLHGGSGLGLAIAATIAEGHGGRLELETTPGNGCTFRLVLPEATFGQDPR